MTSGFNMNIREYYWSCIALPGM